MRFAPYRYNLDYNILATHIDAQWRIMPKLFLHVAARMEMMDHHYQLMPRTTLSYIPNKRWQFSLVAGQYSQTAEDDILAQSNESLCQSTASHIILSMQYNSASSLLRIEPYYKRYSHLPLLHNSIYQSDGYGNSKGVDIYVENHSISRFTTTMAYSFNDSERLYMDYTEPRTPGFASRHNLRLTAKYSIGKFIIGIADSYATGRHFANGTTPYYNSLDANITYLLSPKVILYSSLNNILGRTNIFRYDAAGNGITSSRDRFFYIGIFVSLKNNKAYDISNY